MEESSTSQSYHAAPLESSSAGDRPGPYRKFQTPSGIRLIRVFPDLINSHIACELHYFDPPPPDLDYRCLSYVWGEPQPTNPDYLYLPDLWGEPQACDRIYIRRHDAPDSSWHEFECRWNLWRFLDYVRRAGPGICDQLWWADYLCLDQTDEAEKAVQVPRMEEIYSTAREAVIWLDLSEAQEQGLQSIRHISAEELLEAKIKGTLLPYHLEVVSSIFKHEYWTRIWTVQEINLARKFWIITKSIPWVDGDEMVSEYQSVSQIVHPSTCDVPLALRTLKRWPNAKVPLLDLLTVSNESGMQSTVPHDRIYGLLGLVGSNADGTSPRDLIEIDYNKPCSEVLLDALFEAEHDLTEWKRFSCLGTLLRTHPLRRSGLSLRAYLQSGRTSARRKAAADVAIQASDAAKFITDLSYDPYCFSDTMWRELDRTMRKIGCFCCYEAIRNLTTQERAVLIGLVSDDDDAPSTSSPWKCRNHRRTVPRGVPFGQDLIS